MFAGRGLALGVGLTLGGGADFWEQAEPNSIPMLWAMVSRLMIDPIGAVLAYLVLLWINRAGLDARPLVLEILALSATGAVIGFVAGAVLAPLSYWAGVSLGAAQFTAGQSQGMAAVALGWAFALPLLQRLRPTKHVPVTVL